MSVPSQEHPLPQPLAETDPSSPAVGTPPAPSGPFRALRHRNFRLLWIGLAVSALGTWMQTVALGWLVWQMTQSSFYLGLVGFSRAAPILLLSLFGGVLADRLDRRKLLLATQSFMMATALLLGGLVALRAADVWTVLALSLLSATAMAFDMPTRHSLVPELVERDDVMSAVSLNSAAFNAAGVVGPALAGAVLAAVGPAVCFFANGLSFLAVVAALLSIRTPGRRATGPREQVLETLRQGFSYVARTSHILAIIVVTGVAAILGRPYTQLMPVFAESVHHVGAPGLGLLYSAAGLGSVAGALTAAAVGGGRRPGMLVLGAVTAFGVLLYCFAVTTSFPVAIGLLVLVGALNTFYMSSANTLIQVHVPPHLRGRVLSLYTTSAMGFMPLGSMLLGSAGALVGVPQVVLAGGLLTAATAVAVGARVRSLRQLV
ncbi:MAG TPA: MFS transporter [Chloroflexota bacterium]